MCQHPYSSDATIDVSSSRLGFERVQNGTASEDSYGGHRVQSNINAYSSSWINYFAEENRNRYFKEIERISWQCENGTKTQITNKMFMWAFLFGFVDVNKYNDEEIADNRYEEEDDVVYQLYFPFQCLVFRRIVCYFW